MKNEITFLDCTLRDGGYYNRWDFNTDKARELIQALNKAGTQIIEVGYKSPARGSFFGLFKYCNEDFLDFLSKEDQADYAFMIDVKEFIQNGAVDTDSLDACILPASASVFTWVRMATHATTVETIPAFTTYFRDKGYKVGFNLMGGSLLSREELRRGAEIATLSNVDVFYLADSFGSFYPEDVQELLRFLKQYYGGVLGIHTHDNQGMALANSLKAIEEGVQFVDATVTGMGRGAGNLMTEQFLLGYANKYGDNRYQSSALLPIIADYIGPMKAKHKWGYDYTYMLSGLNNIHPTYCQALIETDRFTNEEISQILEKIPRDNRTKFKREILNEAIEQLIEVEQSSLSGNQVTHFNSNEIASKQVIILARGKSAEDHIGDILKLAKRNKIPLVECNPTNYIAGGFERFLVILNQLKLNSWIKSRKQKDTSNSEVKVVVGLPLGKQPNGEPISYFPFKIGSFDPFKDEVQIPDYDAGIYAIALAMHAGCKDILLAGFDGYENQELHLAKEALNQQILEVAHKNGVEISHITPSTYQTFYQKSVYTI